MIAYIIYYFLTKNLV